MVITVSPFGSILFPKMVLFPVAVEELAGLPLIETVAVISLLGLPGGIVKLVEDFLHELFINNQQIIKLSKISLEWDIFLKVLSFLLRIVALLQGKRLYSLLG